MKANQVNQFKSGDRVYWKGNDNNSPESGTVQYTEDTFGGSVWVIWDSDGDLSWIHPHEISILKSYTPEFTSEFTVEFTVESCLEFLASKGYSVTLTKL